MTARDPAAIAGWHAHIYYDPASRPRAEALRERIAAGFAVRLGRWHDQPVGPHPQAMYQVAFGAADFVQEASSNQYVAEIVDLKRFVGYVRILPALSNTGIVSR